MLLQLQPLLLLPLQQLLLLVPLQLLLLVPQQSVLLQPLLLLPLLLHQLCVDVHRQLGGTLGLPLDGVQLCAGRRTGRVLRMGRR